MSDFSRFTKRMFFAAIALLAMCVSEKEPLAQDQTETINISAFEGYADVLAESFIAKMKEKHGLTVKIESHIANNPDDLYKEAKSGWADILSLDHHLFFSEVWPYFPEDAKPLLQPIPIQRIEKFNEISPLFLKKQFLYKEENIYGIPFAAGTYGLAYNADKISDPPTSWNDLWNVRYQNLYSLTSDYSECNIYLTALALGVDQEHIYNPDEIFIHYPINEFRTKLNELARNAKSFWKSTADIEEMKSLALTTTWGYGVQQANQMGQNWKYADVKEGVTAYFDAWALSSTVDPNSTKYKICLEWINHNLQKEMQIAAVREWGMTPVIQNLESEFTPEEIASFHIGNTSYWERASFWEILKRVTYHTNNAMWTNAMAQKSQGAKTFVSQRDQLKRISEQGATRYIRGKKLAAEARMNQSHTYKQKTETVVFPQDLHYAMTLYALSKGMTKSEIIIDAVQNYMNDNPLDGEAKDEEETP